MYRLQRHTASYKGHETETGIAQHETQNYK